MKKLSLYVFLVLMWCNVGFAERVTLGFAGDSCKSFNESKDEFGKEFEDLSSSRKEIANMKTDGIFPFGQFPVF